MQATANNGGLLKTYGKAALAALYFVAVTAVPLFGGDHHIDPGEGIIIATAGCNAVLVYLVPLAPTAKWTKTAVAAMMAGLQIASTVIIGGLDGNDLVLIAGAVLGALGVAAAPAASALTAARVGWFTNQR